MFTLHWKQLPHILLSIPFGFQLKNDEDFFFSYQYTVLKKVLCSLLYLCGFVSDQLSVRSNDSHNTYSPSFQLDVGHLLEEFPESDRDEEATQVLFDVIVFSNAISMHYNLLYKVILY